MNQDDWKTYIEANRDGDAKLLDLAVNAGLIRAKRDRLDYRKLFHLAATCAATILFCVTIHAEPVKSLAEGLLLRNSSVTQSSSEALFYYLSDIKDVVITHLGGHE